MRRRDLRPRRAALQAALRDARYKSGLTQVDLAKRLGRPQSFVSKYESGERRLDVAEFQEICQVLGASATRILNRIP